MFASSRQAASHTCDNTTDRRYWNSHSGWARGKLFGTGAATVCPPTAPPCDRLSRSFDADLGFSDPHRVIRLLRVSFALPKPRSRTSMRTLSHAARSRRLRTT
jgi:hypothetical protein